MTPNEVKTRIDDDLWSALWRISRYENMSIATVVEIALTDYVFNYYEACDLLDPLDPEVVL